MTANLGLAAIGATGCLAVAGFCLWLCYRASRAAAIEGRPDTRMSDTIIDPMSSQRCWARLLFCHSDGLTLVLDAVVEECDGANVPVGTPFSLRVATPPSAGRWVAAQLTLFAEGERLVLAELHCSASGTDARLLASDLALVLRLEEASGWPVRQPPAERSSPT